MGEGCVTVTWIQFNLSLLQITGETKYAEEIERSVYNHLLAAENPQSGCVSYYTALQGAKPYRCDQGYSCCLSSVPRGVSLIPEMMGGEVNGSFSVLLYENAEASSRIRTKDAGEIDLHVKCKTRFPSEGIVDYEISPSKAAAFTINFRIPEWSANFKARAGNQIYEGKKGGFLSINRKWKEGDHLEITFGMPVEILSGGISYPNAIAIKRGPQVLAVDKGLNAGIDSFNTVTYTNSKSLTDAGAALPADWEWKEAFYLDAKVNDSSHKIVLVPFAEAGQKANEIEVWIAR
jgi:DUF1680 family protein